MSEYSSQPCIDTDVRTKQLVRHIAIDCAQSVEVILFSEHLPDTLVEGRIDAVGDEFFLIGVELSILFKSSRA